MKSQRKKSDESRATRISRVYFNRLFPKRMDALELFIIISI